MCLESEEKEVIKEIMPRDESSKHYETHEVSLKHLEHIVAARINVDKEYRVVPCLIELVIYDLV